MSDFVRVTTSAEVWAVIRARHGKDMVPFSSFSDPDGTFNGGPGEVGRMETTYGFAGSDFEFIGARTTWDIDPSRLHVRVNEEHRYWLSLPKKEQS